ncbi:hypothetical protein M6B38_332930 [Iris pallida]|uniref:Uncharacterized protein n=1 Tax=Iris pallida TaxID=29817 RepID=A0AAX6H1Z2_IRIPA|nr:hypothetical protein M6B38_332930 [Iris pallida]
MGTCITFSGNMNTCWEHIIFVGEMCSFLGTCITYARNMSSCCEHIMILLGKCIIFAGKSKSCKIIYQFAESVHVILLGTCFFFFGYENGSLLPNSVMNMLKFWKC